MALGGAARWELRAVYQDAASEALDAALHNGALNGTGYQEAAETARMRRQLRRSTAVTAVDDNGRLVFRRSRDALRSLRLMAMERIQSWERLPEDGGREFRYVTVAQTKQLRSRVEPELLLLLPHIPSKGKVRSGHTKTNLHAAEASKLHALDSAYIRVRDDAMGMFRVDIDAAFRSEGDFRRQLLEALGGDRSLLPYLAAGSISPDGRFHRPHLWFVLETPVSGRVGASAKARRLLSRAMHLVVNKLIGIGADPGGLNNPLHGKNPLSEVWDLVHFGRTIPDLKTFAEALDDGQNVDRELLMRRQADAILLDDSPTKTAAASNAAFNLARAWAVANIRAFREADAERVIYDVDEDEGTNAFIGELATYLRTALPDISEAALARLAANVGGYVWKQSEASLLASRGAARHLIVPSDDLRARQSKGGSYARSAKQEKTIATLRGIVVALRQKGTEVTRKAVVEAAVGSVSQATVYRLWGRILDAEDFLTKCSDKKCEMTSALPQSETDNEQKEAYLVNDKGVSPRRAPRTRLRHINRGEPDYEMEAVRPVEEWQDPFEGLEEAPVCSEYRGEVDYEAEALGPPRRVEDTLVTVMSSAVRPTVRIPACFLTTPKGA